MTRVPHGQALVESVVGLLLLVPLLLALQTLAELQSAADQSVQSARLLALAASLGGRPAANAAEVENAPRNFTVLTPGSIWSSSLQREAEPAAALAVTRKLKFAVAPAERIAGNRVRFETQGWVVASARVGVRHPAILGDLLPAGLLTTQARMTLLTEDGQASARSEVLEKLRPLAAMRPLRTVIATMRPVTALLAVMDPSFRRLCAGAPDPDLLPADRLLGGAAVAQPQQVCR